MRSSKMKLIVKVPCHPLVSDAIQLQEGKENFGELLEQVSLLMKPFFIGPFEVSLNGKDLLKASNDDSLSSIGLVSGDIIRVIIDAAIIQKPDKLLKTGSFTENGGTFTEPVHCISTCSPSSGSGSVINELEPQFGAIQNSDSSVPSNFEVAVGNENTIINGYFNKPVLCQEASNFCIPLSLEQLYQNESISSSNDALVLAIHLLMNEAGFNLMVDESVSSSILNSVNGVYKMDYCYPICSGHCQLVIFSWGNVLTVHGILLMDGSCQANSLVTITLPLEHYIRIPPTHDTEAREVYRNLPRLAQQFKDAIVRPLLSFLLSDSNINAKNELMSLPNEIKLSILWHLDTHSLLAMAATCTEFTELTKEEQLWKHLSFIDFKTSATAYANTNSKTISWRLFYKRKFLEKRELKNCRQIKHMGICRFNPFPDVKMLPILPSRGFMPSPLGIVGEDYGRFIAVSPEFPGLSDARPNLNLLNPRPRQTSSSHFPHFI